MSQKNLIAIPARVDVDGQTVNPKGTLSRCCRADHREDRGRPGYRRASERYLAFAPLDCPVPGRQHRWRD